MYLASVSLSFLRTHFWRSERSTLRYLISPTRHVFNVALSRDLNRQFVTF